MRISGVALDIYDDPKALAGMLGGRPLPEKLASSRLLDPEELEALPDRLFALVSGDGSIRKYAMCDEAHLTTSILYFLKQGQVLSEDARSKVAANLVNACAWYDLDPPEILVKQAMGKAIAGLGTAAALGLGAMDVANKTKDRTARNRQSFDSFRAAQVSGDKIAAGNTVELGADEVDRIVNSEGLVSGKGTVMTAAEHQDNDEMARRKLQKQTAQGYQIDPLDSSEKSLKNAPKEKKADLTGTEMMPRGILQTPVRGNPSKKVATPPKVAHLRVDSDLVAPPVIKQARYDRYALPERAQYPLDTAGQVKQAQAYFDEYCTEFDLQDRRTFAQNLAQRAEELGVKIAGETLKYAGSGYGPYIDSELTARIRGFEGTGHEAAYELLQEKRASIDPVVMVEMLKAADRATGADRSYGRPATGFRDPYQAVYGKVAQEATLDKQDTYSWTSGTDYVSGMQLSALAAGGANLDEAFGEGFTKKFREDPVAMFQSLPEPHKVILSRMAADNSGTTSRI